MASEEANFKFSLLSILQVKKCFENNHKPYVKPHSNFKIEIA